MISIQVPTQSPILLLVRCCCSLNDSKIIKPLVFLLFVLIDSRRIYLLLFLSHNIPRNKSFLFVIFPLQLINAATFPPLGLMCTGILYLCLSAFDSESKLLNTFLMFCAAGAQILRQELRRGPPGCFRPLHPEQEQGEICKYTFFF